MNNNFIKFALSEEPVDIWRIICFEARSNPKIDIGAYSLLIYFKYAEPDQATQNFIKFLQDNEILNISAVETQFNISAYSFVPYGTELNILEEYLIIHNTYKLLSSYGIKADLL